MKYLFDYSCESSFWVGSRLDAKDAPRWNLTEDKAIAGIKDGTWAFYVTHGGNTVRVIVAVSRFGHEYLKTVADNEQPDNLLSLPECP